MTPTSVTTARFEVVLRGYEHTAVDGQVEPAGRVAAVRAGH